MNTVDGVVGAPSNGTNREAVAAGAVATCENDVGTRVDGNTIILVVDGCVR